MLNYITQMNTNLNMYEKGFYAIMYIKKSCRYF